MTSPTSEMSEADWFEIASRRKPKKWLNDDDDNPTVNPEWVVWRDAMARCEIITTAESLGANPYTDLGQYFPEDFGKAIPPEGAWIRVVQEPHTELKSRFQVPLLSMWRARPGRMNAGKREGRSPRLAVIDTPGGELWLWHSEYVMVPDIMAYVGMEPDVEMHQMSGDPLFTEDDEERLFYLQSRGLTRVEAAKMMLPGLEDTKFCYFTMHPEYLRYFGFGAE